MLELLDDSHIHLTCIYLRALVHRGLHLISSCGISAWRGSTSVSAAPRVEVVVSGGGKRSRSCSKRGTVESTGVRNFLSHSVATDVRGSRDPVGKKYGSLRGFYSTYCHAHVYPSSNPLSTLVNRCLVVQLFLPPDVCGVQISGEDVKGLVPKSLLGQSIFSQPREFFEISRTKNAAS